MYSCTIKYHIQLYTISVIHCKTYHISDSFVQLSTKYTISVIQCKIYHISDSFVQLSAKYTVSVIHCKYTILVIHLYNYLQNIPYQ